MNASMTVRLALKNIKGNRLRSGLTMLGLVIGILSVILLVGLANGATSSIMDDFSSMGADVITVNIYDSESGLSYTELDELKSLDLIENVSPYSMLEATVSKGGSKVKGTSLVGCGADYADMIGVEVEKGRNLSPIDIENSIKAVVIGSDIAKKLWKSKDPCGDTLKIDGDDYTVVGVLKSMGSTMGNNTDKTVLMPISTAQYLGAEVSITEIYIKAASEEDVDAATADAKAYFRDKKKIEPDYMDVFSQKQMLKSMEEANRTLSLLLGGIASISLLVGGIGVMNVMLVSVTERTREIGIRKSLGAKKKDILIQFLMESTVLSVLGGLIGIVSGIGIGRIISLFGTAFSPGVGMMMISFAVSVSVGLVFGILPASRAAKMKPVDALRYE